MIAYSAKNRDTETDPGWPTREAVVEDRSSHGKAVARLL